MLGRYRDAGGKQLRQLRENRYPYQNVHVIGSTIADFRF